MLLARESAEEAPEHHLEALVCILRRQLRDRWLFPNDALQLSHEGDDELTIRSERLAQRVPPPAKLRVALREKRADEGLEGLAHRRVWDVALVLVELAGREQTTRRYEHLVQLVYDRGFADPGIAGYAPEFRRADTHDPVEGRDERVNLPPPAVPPLHHHHPPPSLRRPPPPCPHHP